MIFSDGSLDGCLVLALSTAIFCGLSWLIYKLYGPKKGH